MDRDDLIDRIESAMDRVHDMDVTFRTYAESVADAVMPLVTDRPAPAGTEGGHTPGSWEAVGARVFAVCRDGRRHWIANADSPFVQDAEANAALIAAAPATAAERDALVAECNRLREMLAGMLKLHEAHHNHPVHVATRAAINLAKARDHG